ncbi:MAG: PKD domain-containing protein, partial [Candidatus Bipolaricaulis sp.]|nr:PKD domain-containing protein [Candidatus Bipolaricaulis sp.]
MIRRVVAIMAVLIAARCVLAVAPEATCGPIRISEVCWGGRPEDPGAEWVELVNTTDDPVDLDGWRLVSSDGSPDIALSGTIFPVDPASPARGYFLLERNSDDAVPGVAADLIYSGALNDRGEILFLYDSAQNLVDTANALPKSSEAPPWAAGTNAHGVPPCRSMERIAPCLDDAPTAWATCPPIGEDATLGGPGTPRRQNRASNLAPEAFFRVDPPSPAPGRAARFDATGSSDESGWIDRYVWDFGDGTTETGPAVTSHTYALPGRYEASLAVVDDQGAVAHARQWIDVALSRPPVADFSVRSLSGRRELFTLDRLRFQDESSDEETEVAAWSWSFGDGASTSAQHPEHTYVRPGRYTVSLTVADEQGDQSVQTESLRIANRPPAAAFSFGPSSPSQGEAILLDASPSTDA